MLIDGKRVEGDNTFSVLNPYNNAEVGKVPIATAEQVKQALDLAAKAKNTLTGKQRADILLATAEALEKRKQEFAESITAESGLCIKQTLYEVGRTLNVLKAAADIAVDIERDISSKYHTGQGPKLTVVNEPMHLVVGITPFNHPLNQVAHKICPTIAAGTPVVLKPSEKTPLTALKFAELLHENGLPANMLNVITGHPPQEVVEQLVTHPEVECVSFTGAVHVGKIISEMMISKGNPFARQVYELGGNAACIILEDADLEKAAEICKKGAFGNSGQRCTAIKRILVVDSVADAFVEKFLTKAKALKYGDPMDPENDVGTVIDENAAVEIQRRVEDAIKDGAQLLCGNERQGALYSPTVLDNVKPDSELVVKETFGPVAPIIRVKDADEAIAIVNASPFKLAGAAITADVEKAKYIANAVKVGQFNWNNQPGYRTENAPFGGFGCSGNHVKEGVTMATKNMRKIRTFYEHP